MLSGSSVPYLVYITALISFVAIIISVLTFVKIKKSYVGKLLFTLNIIFLVIGAVALVFGFIVMMSFNHS